MADDAATAAAENAGKSGLGATLKKLAIPRSATPYLVAAVVAATAMAWYFYVFVPQKREYFVGLRFRTLAVASGQIKGKAENLGRSFSSAPRPASKSAPARASATAKGNAEKPACPPENDTNPTADYLRLLVPDIRLVCRGGGTHEGLNLSVGTDRPAAVVAWDRVAAPGAAASRQDFDDLVLADKDGRVVWQREQTTPRLGTLKELLQQPDDQTTLLSSSGALAIGVTNVDDDKTLPKTATLKRVRIGTMSTWMLVQSVGLESPYIGPDQRQLYVAGFVTRDRLERQAMRIPLAWLAVVWLPVAVLFLALPFIKLATMNAKERFSALNLVLMAVSTIAAAGLGAAIPIGPRAESLASDAVLTRIAGMLNENLGAETNRVLTLAKRVVAIPQGAKKLRPCVVHDALRRWKTATLCDLWGALPDYDGAATPELDVAIWLDDRGDQAWKLTTKAQLTGPTSHRDYEHFQDLAAGGGWTLEKIKDYDTAIPFTIEPLRAPTTAERAVVYAIPLASLPAPPTTKDLAKNNKKEKAKQPVDPRADARYLALNVRPHALVEPVMPPGYGYAIVAPGGRVLFHSTDGLSLEENFFEEVSDAPGVRERMRADATVTWSGDYHGVPHRLHVTPATVFAGAHWKIVTFQDLNPVLASMVEHQSGTFRLSLLNLLALVLAATIGWVYTRLRGRDVRDLLATAQPDPKRLWPLIVLLVGAAALAFGMSSFAPHRTNVLYWSFLALPFLTLGVCLYARWPGASPDTERKSWLVRCELCLVVVLVGAIPAAGFAHIVGTIQHTRSIEQWLTIAHQRLIEHTEATRARVKSSSYFPERRALFAKAVEGKLPKKGEFSYLDVVEPTLGDSNPTEKTRLSQAGQGIVRAILDWTPLASERPEETHVKASVGDSTQLQLDDSGLGLVAHIPRTADDFRWERWLLLLIILGGTIAATYWAQGRLVSPHAIGTADIDKALELMGTDGSQGIMLIGPPRLHKDATVKMAVARFGKLKKGANSVEPIYRLRLLDEKVTPDFVKIEVATMATRAQDKSLHDDKGRVWIHVSNLEAQLDTKDRRTAVLELLEKLLKRGDDDAPRVVVVTTSVDPIAHFREIFTKERQAIQGDDIPEIELSRSSLLLSRFRRCYLPIKTSALPDPWWDYDPATWTKTLAWEAAEYPPLVEVKNAVEKTLSARATPPSRDELARVFRSKALAAYDLLWASCTRHEKILLIQLAQEGFYTTPDYEVVWSLINKGLIVERSTPTIFNYTFRQYLRQIEHDHVVEAWEREEGDGLWLVAGRLIASSVVAGGVFYLTTQDFSVDGVLSVVSGTGVFGVPILRTLLAKMSLRGVASVTA